MDIKEKYKPYNFSETRCFIVPVDISAAGSQVIDVKLPLDMKVLKGIYVTGISFRPLLVLGMLSLSFNEGIHKSVALAVKNPNPLRHHSHPITLNEEIKNNSTMQGFFFSNHSIDNYPMFLKIYLHYEQKL